MGAKLGPTAISIGLSAHLWKCSKGRAMRLVLNYLSIGRYSEVKRALYSVLTNTMEQGFDDQNPVRTLPCTWFRYYWIANPLGLLHSTRSFYA